ncbi:MAG: hypothetical protein F4Z30_01115 [Gemmatimonadetes bacterium]|nr:hypothetical protein [Gemmatimonadota bacterium]
MMASDRDSIFERVYDKGTVQWILGILVALWLAVSGFLYAEIAAVRADVASNGERLARIETLLQERLPPAD